MATAYRTIRSQHILADIAFGADPLGLTIGSTVGTLSHGDAEVRRAATLGIGETRCAEVVVGRETHRGEICPARRVGAAIPILWAFIEALHGTEGAVSDLEAEPADAIGVPPTRTPELPGLVLPFAFPLAGRLALAINLDLTVRTHGDHVARLRFGFVRDGYTAIRDANLVCGTFRLGIRCARAVFYVAVGVTRFVQRGAPRHRPGVPASQYDAANQGSQKNAHVRPV